MEYKQMLNNPHIPDSELREVAKGNARLTQLYTEKDDRYFEAKTSEEFEEMCQQAKKALADILDGDILC